MTSMKVLDWLTGRSLARRSRNENLLLTTEQFQAALRRERLRSDRHLVGFSLLTISLKTKAKNDDVLRLASQIVQGRIRETDVAGWFKRRTLGIILPDTPAEGAWTLANDLSKLLGEKRVAAHFEVYTYPSFDFDEPSDETPLKDDSLKEVSPDIRRIDQPVQPLEVLFLQRLPVWKRAIDIVGATVGLVVASPVMLLAALAIKATSPGPIIFKQRRDTLGGRPFMIFKFRTMSVDAEQKKSSLMALNEQDGPAFKIANDPRVTRVGRFLRVTSIDELPQLFNVLRGEMTLVGPRAMDSNESRRCERWQRRRLDVTAGLTCIWQVRGRSSVTFAEWMRMDLSYVQSRSLKKDLQLIAQTVPAVLLRRGAC